MKTICITGSIDTDLNFINGILTQAGMEKARSAQRDESLTIDFWHKQVESRINELTQQNEPVELGRVWEQIASDIFVANMSEKTWGWADSQSVRVLDFWQKFDSQIRFVLVACSAQRYIAHALSTGESIVSVKSLMAAWAQQQLQLLQFLHHFPNKTILVDIEQCIDNPAGLIKACQQNWQLSLSKVHFPAQTATQFTTLEQFLARELSHTDDQWQVLQNELWSSATPVGTPWNISSQIDVFDAVKAYRNEKAKHNEKLVTQSESIKAELKLITKQSESLMAEVESLKKEVDAEKAIANDTQKALKINTAEANPLAAQLKDAQEEAELLLTQLHQVQEELEHYFLKYQDVKNELESADLRWKRMLQRQPDYFDLESIEVVDFNEPKSLHINWRLKGLDAAGRTIPEFNLTSTVEGGVACLEIPRKMGEQAIFARWPLAVTNKETLTVAVVGDEKNGRERADILLQLSRSDWDLVQIILNVLINEIQTLGLLKLPKEFPTDKILESFKLLKTRMAQLPPVFRFDELQLKREQVNPDYEHLWLDFRHVAIGSKRLLDFDFRISCANVRPTTFGEYPKLEFPEATGRAAIKGWFDEAYDDFGAKLELRFSFPQSMDLQVWEQLPEEDKMFLSSLINQIPTLLSEIESSGLNVKRGWADWQQMAQEVRRILAICTAPKTELEKPEKVVPEGKKVTPSPRAVTKRKTVKK